MQPSPSHSSGPLSISVRLLRVKQWTKNGFVLTPLLFSGLFIRTSAVIESLLAVAAFSLVASAVYIVNDLADLQADRQHPRKKHRPIASGRVSVAAGVVSAAICAAGGFSIGLMLGFPVAIVLAVYVALQIAYTAVLKHVAIIDAMAIAMGFILRVYAGAFSIQVPVSSWFLLTAFFLALYLALAKRKAELAAIGPEKTSPTDTLATAAKSREAVRPHQRPVLRMYSVRLLDQLLPLTLGLTVVSYSLYTVDPDTVTRLGTDRLIFTVPIVLYGMFRYLLLMNRDGSDDDPSAIFVTDRGMLLAVATWVVVTGLVLLV